MLPRQDLGRRHDGRLPARFDGARHGEERDRRLARSDVALEQAQHALVGGHVAADVGERALLRAGEREGEGVGQLRDQPAVADIAAARLPAHPAADQRKGELRGEELVIGEPPARRARGARFRISFGGIGRAVEPSERFRKGREAVAREPGRVLPLRQRRHTLQRRRDELPEHARGDAFGEPVHRLDRWKLPDRALVEDAVGMDHLAVAVPELELARDVALRADGQELLDAVARHIEEDEEHVAAVVLDEDAVRRLAALQPRAMLAHPDLEGQGLPDRRLGDGALEVARDAAMGKVEQEVEHPRRPLRLAEQAIEQSRHLRPDPGQRRRGREQRVQDRGTERHRTAGIAGGPDSGSSETARHQADCLEFFWERLGSRSDGARR
jgi:hypothetical protein